MEQLIEQLIEILRQNMPEVEVVPEFSKQVIPLERIRITVGNKTLEQQNGIQQTVIHIGVYVPFYMESNQCNQMTDKILVMLSESTLTGYQGIAVGGITYHSKADAFYTEIQLRFFHSSNTISFGSIKVPCDPETVSLVCKRHLVSRFSAFLGEVIQDLGKKSRIFSFEGVLSKEQYQQVYQLYLAGEKQTVILPDESEMDAVLSSFSIKKILPNGWNCRFIFTEVTL